MVGLDQHAVGVTQGVGRTALMVAAARAIETHRPDTLAGDPYAEEFVRAAAVSADWPLRIDDVPGGDANPLWGRLARYFGLRTRVLDDFLLGATGAGITQVVLFGAGLDTRAFRLDWPPDRIVFEVDTAHVLAFKDDVLGSVGAVPRATRVPIAADLRLPWVDRLLGAGFDPTLPTAWLAEGLLLYLPAAAERQLFDGIHRLSAPGSTLGYEVKLGVESPEVRESPVYTATKSQIDLDLISLFDGEPRPDSAADLTARGWATTVHTPFDFTRRHGRGPLPLSPDALSINRWVFAEKPHH